MMTIDSLLSEFKARIVAIVTHEKQISDVTDLWTAFICEMSKLLLQMVIVCRKASFTWNNKKYKEL